MPKVHEMVESKFLKKEDVGYGVLATIKEFSQENVAMQGADPEMKWTMHFEELDKPLVLNSTNLQICKMVFQSDDTDDWAGKQIVLYTDHNVSFGGKLVGGIRLRAPKNKVSKKRNEPDPQNAENKKRLPEKDAGKFDDMEDDIPF